MTTLALHRQTQQHRFLRQLYAAIAALITVRPTVAATPAAAGEDALKVRALASRYAATDPGFSADLYAAAARHEALADV